jgi:hypothetical protein
MAQDKSGSVEGNLDITQVENEDLDALASKIESFYKQDSTVKTRLTYNWDRNHKFLDGNQWIVFDGDQQTGGMWKRLTVSKANEYIPRPVTNYIFDAYQTLKSYLIKNKPRSSVRPNTQTFKDKAAAKIADLCLEANWERLVEQSNYEYAASCLLTYGTVFKKDYWDTTSVSMVKIPRMQQQPQLDPQTGMQIGMIEVPEVDPETGEEMFDELPLGDVNTEVVEPYRIAIDPAANDLHKIRWIMEYSIQPISWIEETYGKEGPGYTGKIDEVKEEKALSGSMRRFYALKNSSGVKNSTALAEGSTSAAGDVELSNQAVIKEYYERPTAKYPKGRMVVVANSICLYAGDSPYSGSEQGDWHPYSECRWEIVPGRFWGKSPLDVGVEIQKQINSIDAVIVLTRKTMAIPQKLIPTSAGIAPGTWTGRPGQEVPYRDAGGAKPEIIQGHGVDTTVFQERAQRLEDLKNTMGAIDILKGDRPPGVTAASALNLLYEVGTGKLFPILDRWKKLVENSQKKQLKIITKMYKEPRPDYIRLLMAKNSELSEEAINKFIGTDLYDNCNVTIEAGSNVPKLQAAKQAALQEAAQVGVLGLELPANRMEYQRQMGIEGFDNDVGPDVKRAEWENDLLDNIELSPDNRPLVLAVDNHEIHMDVLARRMKEPSFMSASGPVQQAYMAHYQEHMDADAQAKQAATLEAMANGQNPADVHQQQGGNAPSPAQSHGKGATKEMKNVLNIDAMVPGQK